MLNTGDRVADYRVENHVSLFLVRPLNDAARAYLESVTSGMWHGDALVVEPRYVDDLVTGLQNDGFVAVVG